MRQQMDEASQEDSAGQVTKLLRAWKNGDDEALDQLMAGMMGSLHVMARRFFQGESGAHTLQPTALINELYVRLLGGQRLDAKDRVHFLGLAGRRMRQILIDHARKKQSRSPSGNPRLTLSLQSIGDPEGPMLSSARFLSLNQAMERLRQKDARKHHIVELRYFAGLTTAETGLALGLSERTVYREWLVARTRLFQDLQGGLHE